MKKTVWVIAIAVAVPRLASAASWAALEELPVVGGELRRTTPTPHGGVGFPVRSVDFDARVDGVVATVTSEQVFDNPFPDTIEAVYLFPMSNRAAVYGYEIQVGERIIRGRIKQRAEAQRIYQQAKVKGHTAGLVEQVKPNVFTQAVANIPPGETVRVRLSYVEQLAYEDGVYEMAMPLLVGPRYLPGHTEDPAPVGDRPRGPSAAVGQIAVHLAPGVPIAEVSSPSHELDQRTIDAATREVGLLSSTALDRDFVLRWRTAGVRTYAGLLTGKRDGTNYFNLIVQPKLSYESSEIAPREVVLLIDRSCSMAGAPMRHAQEIAERIVSSLDARDTFNIIAFSNQTRSLRKGPVHANPTFKQLAYPWIRNLRAAGGTEMLRGVGRSLLRKPEARRIRHVIVLTDGEVGNDDEILNAVGKYAQHNRVFPVGLGSTPNRYLLDRLGSDSRGFASYVAVGENSQGAVDRIIQKTSRPYLTGLEIDWKGLKVSEVQPRRLPDVYAGQPLVISGKFKPSAPGKIHVLGRVGGRPVDIPISVDFAAADAHAGVPLVWAKRKIDGLMSADPLAKRKGTEAQITQLGLRFGLITPYTAYVAVDDDRRIAQTASRVVEQQLAEPAETPQPVARDVVAYNPPPRVSNNRPARTPRRVEPRRRRRKSWGGGGGGDLDPITITTILTSAPLAWQLRRRRKKKDRA